MRQTRRILLVAFVIAAFAQVAPGARARGVVAATRFEVSYPSALDPGPVTGRVFVMISKTNQREPRLQAGSYNGSVPFFGVDVSALGPDQGAVVDAATPGYPVESLSRLPAGDYYVQALLNVYTEFHRKDGPVIWAHMDQWEGQKWNTSPGNLVSDVQQVHLDPAGGFDVKLSLTKKIPPVTVPPDTAWVKHVKVQSRLLSEFWGHPFYVGATVLLPKGFDEHPTRTYPGIYIQGHFGLGAPFGFTDQAPTSGRGRGRGGAASTSARESGAAFGQSWMSDEFPRFVAVTFQHPTPYYDDSYAVNSANNGPYGDALTTELMPYLEEHFRISATPAARVLTGGSTGGWEALALQVFHPKLFGGTWVFYPDPVDFRRYQMSNIYEDQNAFTLPAGDWATIERPLSRDASGQVTLTMREMNRLEAVLGSNVRSGQQIAAWDAAYGPTDADGYPRPVWDRLTGRIDRDVALYMRDHGYDLSYNITTHWPTLGPDLAGKVHVYVGDMDNYYLDLAVYLLEDAMTALDHPKADATFEYGRPMKGHGWQPMSNADLVRMMAAHINKSAPGTAVR
jgi:Putative esterase